MLASKFISVIHIHISRVQAGTFHTLARDQDELVVEQRMAGEPLTALRRIAECNIDQTDCQPAVDRSLLARPKGERYARVVFRTWSRNR